MKKWATICATMVAMLVVSATVSSAAMAITWGYGGDLNADAGITTEGWLVQMFHDVTGDGITLDITRPGGVTTIGGGDALLTGISSSTLTDARSGNMQWGDVVNVDNSFANEFVYTVIFNASDISSASQYIVIDSSTYQLPNADVGGTYSLSATAETSTWQPVPEPGSIALMLVGIAAIGARRKFKRG